MGAAASHNRARWRKSGRPGNTRPRTPGNQRPIRLPAPGRSGPTAGHGSRPNRHNRRGSIVQIVQRPPQFMPPQFSERGFVAGMTNHERQHRHRIAVFGPEAPRSRNRPPGCLRPPRTRQWRRARPGGTRWWSPNMACDSFSRAPTSTPGRKWLSIIICAELRPHAARSGCRNMAPWPRLQTFPARSQSEKDSRTAPEYRCPRAPRCRWRCAGSC